MSEFGLSMEVWFKSENSYVTWKIFEKNCLLFLLTVYIL